MHLLKESYFIYPTTLKTAHRQNNVSIATKKKCFYLIVNKTETEN